MSIQSRLHSWRQSGAISYKNAHNLENKSKHFQFSLLFSISHSFFTLLLQFISLVIPVFPSFLYSGGQGAGPLKCYP